MSDLVCLSHLRWQFVFQRPQHLLTRAARTRRVFYVQEPEFREGPADMRVEMLDGVTVVTPLIADGLTDSALAATQRELLRDLWTREQIDAEVLWFYTPMALSFGADIPADVVVYDCMDELGNFKFASPLIAQRERELLERADLVFAGGRSLYNLKRPLHSDIHLFPSSVDVEHFMSARLCSEDPADQAEIPRPRLGYFGVIDERLDLELVAAVADARPDFQLVFVGPTAKIDEADLPRRPNIHWLGRKTYEELPSYLAGWDVALMPFARNDSTRFISPTKTPEYLAAGRPVVSTSIADVIADYGRTGLVHIADTPAAFVAAIEAALVEDGAARIAQVDVLLQGRSWDRTWADMAELIERTKRVRLDAQDATEATRSLLLEPLLEPPDARSEGRGDQLRSAR